MELLKTIEDDQDVECFSESSEDEQVDVQPTNIKNKKVDKNGNKKPISKDFDNEFNFFANAKDGSSDYLADSWSHVAKFLKKKNTNRTTVEAKIKKLRTEKKASNDDEINEDEPSGESSDELSEDELVHDDINIKKLSKKKKKAAEKDDKKDINPEIVVEEEEENEQDDDFFDLPDVAELAQAEANKTFYSMNLSRPLLKAVDALQYVHPTPIQAATIPIALSGRDVCGCAATGTGKTAAYMLPVLERLLFRPKEDSVTRVLLLVPTRELGVQVFQVTKQLCQFTTIDVALSVGGLDLRLQEAALRKNPDIVIATPGRLIDHIKNTPSFGLDSIEVLILDEADRLLEEAFLDQIKEIVKSCAPTRQTMLFSATMTDQVNELAAVSLRRPVKIFVDSNKAVAWNLQQEFVRIRPTHEKESEAVLAALLSRTCRDHAIVFIRTKYTCHRLHIVFGLLGLRVAELHGNMSQTQRLESLRAFRDGTVDILLTTDVAARGLDIVGVKTVVNFQLPNTLEQYIHRVGRTARAGRAGRSVSFATENQRKIVRDIVKHARRPVKARVIPPKIIQKYFKRIAELEPDVARILEEESAEKEIAKLENRANRMQNQLETGTQERAFMEKKKSKNSTDKDIKELKGKKKKQAKWKNSEKMDPTSTREDQKLHDFIGREAKRGRKLTRIRAIEDDDEYSGKKKKRK